MPLEKHQRKVVASVLVMLFVAVAFQGQILATMAESLNRYNRQREELVFWFVLNRQDVTRISRSIMRNRNRAPRRYWIRAGRTGLWWENIRNGTAVNEEYKEKFRMRKENFEKLCNELRPYIERQSTNMRNCIDVETQVAVYLYYTSDGGRLRKTANAFGLSRASVSGIVRRLGKAITEHMGPTYIAMPTSQEAVMHHVSNFRTHHGVPQCLGTVDCTHIDIKQPSENSTDYLNRKSRHSLNVQAACDYRYCFF